MSRRRTEHSSRSRVRRVSLGLCRAHETRREHLLELQEQFGFQTFTSAHYRQFTAELVSLAEPFTAPLSEDQKKKRETLLNICGGNPPNPPGLAAPTRGRALRAKPPGSRYQAPSIAPSRFTGPRFSAGVFDFSSGLFGGCGSDLS